MRRVSQLPPRTGDPESAEMTSTTENAEPTRRVAMLLPPGLAALRAAAAEPGVRLLSTDVFDTLLLRDHTGETARLAAAARLAAERLGVDARALTRLRWAFQDSAYRAVAMEDPNRDTSLTAICAAMATACGLGPEAGDVLHRAEVDVDIRHLRPHRPVLDALSRLASDGMRVIAVSDTAYSAADLRRLLDAVVGEHPVAAVYTSADIGITKHSGALFPAVACREGLEPGQILHVGDNDHADVRMATEAGWSALHIPRSRAHRAVKVCGRLLDVGALVRRAQ
jgi:FMN phosphatase YigB (HAD superfamily)